MVSFSVRKTIGFEIQTRDISNPPKRTSCINLGKGGGGTIKGYKGICTQCIWSRIGYNYEKLIRGLRIGVSDLKLA